MAIDLGGTNARLALVRGREVLQGSSFATREAGDPQELMARLAQEVQGLAAWGSRRVLAPAGLGVASPGVIERATGVVKVSPNLPGWHDIPLAAELARATGLPTALENDANLYALGEYLHGAGRGQRDLACLTLGTGVGGGLIVGGRLVTGALGSGGEIGHSLVELEGRLCGCGAPGCLEAYASATGLKGMLAEALAAGQATALAPEASPEEMALVAREGDALAAGLFARAGQALGRGIVNVVAFTGLDLVVIGGGLAPAWPLMESACRQEMRLRLCIVDPEAVEIAPAQLSDQAPLLGAAAWARQSLRLD